MTLSGAACSNRQQSGVACAPGAGERALVAYAARDTARMRRFVAVFALLIALSALLVGNVANASPALLDRTGATVRSLQIPIIAPPSSDPSFYTGTIGVENGKIEIGDDTATYSTSSCRVAEVDPTALRILSDRSVSCESPAIDAENAAPIESIVPTGSQYGQVRIAVRDASPAGFHVGPVVMRYGNFSDTRPQWTYGGGYLWLYDPGTSFVSSGPRLSAEVLQISMTSGKVVSTAPTPPLTRIELAADDAGLWMGVGSETTGPAGPILYFVGDGSGRASPLPLRGEHVDWIAASGERAWIGIARRSGSLIDTYESPRSAPTQVGPNGPAVPSTDIGQAPFDAPPALSVPGIGIVSLSPGWLTSVGIGTSLQQIGILDPETGHSSFVAQFSAAPAVNLVIQGYVADDDDLFVLVADTTQAWVYRVPLA
jgi:hypothetical protein